MNKKNCISCKEDKNLISFSREKKYSKDKTTFSYYRRNSCNHCRKQQARRRRGEVAHKEYRKIMTLKYRHALSAEEYIEMSEKQENLCGICQNPPGSKALAVDHDHITDTNRGLLCTHCNFGIGWFKDNVEVMQKAIEYLNAHKETVKIPRGKTSTPWIR